MCDGTGVAADSGAAADCDCCCCHCVTLTHTPHYACSAAVNYLASHHLQRPIPNCLRAHASIDRRPPMRMPLANIALSTTTYVATYTKTPTHLHLHAVVVGCQADGMWVDATEGGEAHPGSGSQRVRRCEWR